EGVAALQRSEAAPALVAPPEAAHTAFMTEKNAAVTRRVAIAASLAGAAIGASALPAVHGSPSSEADTERKSGSAARLPVVFLPHGGGPWPFVDLGIGSKAEQAELAAYLRSVANVPKSPPKAVLVISAHWEEPLPTVMTSAQPPLLFDYYGFPPESYQLTWPAPGEPALARRVRQLLGAAGFESAENGERGFDHGTFVPLKLAYPEANVPTLQLSLVRGLDPKRHLALGRALAPLRDEGVFIVGSGMTFHNLRAFGPQSSKVAEAFDAWLRESAQLPEQERDQRLSDWASAPGARSAHPREEHLLPLMVVAGAAGADRATLPYNGKIMDLRLSAYHFG
ncbi:MAG TPA: class III extradiol ring-cleavage dioxygenase, partial [Polyangiaceae bacterium]|nr:class III extradiol ring-cleavage dioxygenase [Polyangiaceae bacterium]